MQNNFAMGAMADLNWDDLKVFLAVARLEGLSAASKVLKMDPATVGRRISRLEEHLAERLFAKSPQGYILTDAGQSLVENAQSAEQAVIGVMDRTRTSKNLLSGVVRIGAPDGMANYLLPQVTAAICAENPDLEIQIVALPRVFNLSKREADLAITVSPPETGRLSVQKLADYHLHLAASEEYLNSHAPISSRHDLKDHRLIGYIPDMIFDKELDYVNEVDEAAPAVMASNSFPVQLNWARAGAGICIVHDFALPSAPELKRILMDEISLKRSFYLIRHADDRKVERLSQFVDLLAGQLRKEVARLEALA